MDYDKRLNEQFKDLEINLVAHDTSAHGLPCYIEVHLGKTPKDKGSLVLDLGNYIYRRFGLRYQMTPEYRGRGKTTTVRWFMSWEDVEPIRLNILKAFDKEKMIKFEHYLPFEFRSLIIQNTSRGVYPQTKTGA
jgi:hypothetical protein